jgi:hypothetical protein
MRRLTCGLLPLSILVCPRSIGDLLAGTNRDCLDINLYGNQVGQNAIFLLKQPFPTDSQQCAGNWRLEVVFIYVGSSTKEIGQARS